ncbi:MAG TPA: tetratricopeptide repeat protein [Silvibacterium sp.]|nr:tetratricopeptide repeat protein [Silvibacterium sp.]
MTAGFWGRWALVCALAVGSVMTFAGMSISRETVGAAQAALSRGHADDALQLLDTALQLDPNDAEASNLRCRVYYAEERWDDAIAACERAVQLASSNSGYHLWLGRAYGGKAEHVSFVAAYKLAKLIRAEFETAVRLDARNGAALSDLGEYYAEAPAVLGGGYGKAEGIARQLDGFDPVGALELRARIAEGKNDYASAEKAFRAKISASHSSAQSWMDLGSFYRRRERWDEMLAAVHSGAVAAERDHGPALADGASTLMKAGREPQLAIEWMRDYLASNALSEDAPAFVIHARIGDLLKQQGDAHGAQQEYGAARALAKDYPGIPANKAH